MFKGCLRSALLYHLLDAKGLSFPRAVAAQKVDGSDMMTMNDLLIMKVIYKLSGRLAFTYC